MTDVPSKHVWKIKESRIVFEDFDIYIYIDEGVRPVAWQQCKHSLFDVRDREGC